MTADTTFPSPVGPWPGGQDQPVFEGGGQDENPSPPGEPPPPEEPATEAAPNLQRLIIKTHAGAFAVYRDGLEEELGEEFGPGWAELKERYPALTIGRAFRGLEGDVADQMEGYTDSHSDSRQKSALREAMTYYEVLLPPGEDQALEVGRAVAQLLERFPNQIEYTYIEAPPAPQPSSDCQDRAYFGLPPRGMNVNPIQGRATDVWPRVVDLERAWRPGSHPELAHVVVLPGFEGPTQADDYDGLDQGDDHATLSLSVLAGKGRASVANPGTLECEGLLPPGAPVFVASSLVREAAGWVERINSQIEIITRPGNGMQRGDILLVELQVRGQVTTDRPVPVGAAIELQPVNQTALSLAALRGIIVIEPAGNSSCVSPGGPVGCGVDLAAIELWGGGQPRRISGSSAVCVAACNQIAADGVITRRADSNYGRAVLCFCWGENVLTEAGGYQGTSAASALIAGAAARLQSAAMTHSGQPLRVTQMRAALRRGTNRTTGLQIGVMPNLNP